MKHYIRKLISIPALALVLGAVAVTGPSLADSKKWRANNHTNEDVRVIYLAEGCAKIGNLCDGKSYTVCKSKVLRPGEETDYEFNDGTTLRRKYACLVNRDKHDIADTYDRKKNGLRLNADNLLQWYDE